MEAGEVSWAETARRGSPPLGARGPQDDAHITHTESAVAARKIAAARAGTHPVPPSAWHRDVATPSGTRKWRKLNLSPHP